MDIQLIIDNYMTEGGSSLTPKEQEVVAAATKYYYHLQQLRDADEALLASGLSENPSLLIQHTLNLSPRGAAPYLRRAGNLVKEAFTEPVEPDEPHRQPLDLNFHPHLAPRRKPDTIGRLPIGTDPRRFEGGWSGDHPAGKE